MSIPIALAIYGGCMFGMGLLIGAAIHRTNPVVERPIRTVKLRGELVDIVLFGPPPAQACTAPSGQCQLAARVPPKTQRRADLDSARPTSLFVPSSQR